MKKKPILLRMRMKLIKWVRLQQRRAEQGSTRYWLINSLFGPLIHKTLYGIWQQRFKYEDFTPPWKTKSVPQPLKTAIEKRWFTPGSTFLDIGCGFGDLSNWVSEQGFDVLGFDWSAAGIQRAKKNYEEKPGKLEYRHLDATDLPTPERKFDTLFDRGCLHIISWSHGPMYAKRISSWAKPNATFLLLMVTCFNCTNAEEKERNHLRTVQYVKDILEPYFEFQSLEKDTLQLDSGTLKGQSALPSITVRMRRRVD